MKYFIEAVLPECTGGIYLAFRDGAIPAGIAKEAKYFLENGLPLWEVTLDLELISRREIPQERVLSVADTRARIRDGEGNTIPY